MLQNQNLTWRLATDHVRVLTRDHALQNLSIVREVHSVRERDTEREREREKDGSDVTIVALKLAMSFALLLAKNVHLRPRLHVSGSSGYPAPDRPFVYTYPGQMYAIRSITVRYPERFENDFKGGQPGCLDPFSSSVNGVPGYPDRFWIQFSMAKKN